MVDVHTPDSDDEHQDPQTAGEETAADEIAVDEVATARQMLATDTERWATTSTADTERRRTRDLIALVVVIIVVVVPLIALTALREPTADTTQLDAPALLDEYSTWIRTGRGLDTADATAIWERSHRRDLGGGRTSLGLVDRNGDCWSIVIGPGTATAAATDDPDACGSDTDSTTSRQGASS